MGGCYGGRRHRYARVVALSRERTRRGTLNVWQLSPRCRARERIHGIRCAQRVVRVARTNRRARRRCRGYEQVARQRTKVVAASMRRRAPAWTSHENVRTYELSLVVSYTRQWRSRPTRRHGGYNAIRNTGVEWHVMSGARVTRYVRWRCHANTSYRVRSAL